jgi:hypothetical protein
VFVGQHPEERLEPAFGAAIATIEGSECFLDAQPWASMTASTMA